MKNKLLRILLIISFIFCVLCIMLSYFGQFNWILDLISHFRVQFLILLTVLFFLARLLQLKYLVTASFLFLTVLFLPFIPFYVFQKPSTENPSRLIMAANVMMDNQEYGKTIAYIKKINPDIVVLEEVNASWVKNISELKKTYPYQVSDAREDYYGIILLSKSPLKNLRIEKFGKANIPTVVTDVTIGKKTITLIGTHPVPPYSQKNTELRNDQIEQLAAFIKKQKQPTVLVGDLNSTPFSYPYKKLVSDAKLTNCANGFGYYSTWRLEPFVPPLGLAIDHCLYTDGIIVLDSYVGEDISSDHKPIINKISVK